MLQTITLLALPSATSNEIPPYDMIIFFGLVAALCSLVRPYTRSVANASAVTMLSLISVLFALSIGNNPQGSDMVRVRVLILLSAPHCALGSYIVWKIIKKMTSCCRRHRGMEDGERERLVHSPTNALGQQQDYKECSSIIA